MNSINILPLFPNIKKGDYKTPLKTYLKFYKKDPSNKKLKSKLKQQKQTTCKQCSTKDNEMLYYTLCRPKSKLVVSSTKLEELEKISYYTKHVKLPPMKKAINNFQTLLSLLNYNKYIHIKKIQNIHEIYIYLFEDDEEQTIKTMNTILVKTRNFIETVLYAKMLLNENTYKYLDIQDLTHIWKCKGCIMKYRSFVEYIYKNMSLLEIEFMILSSGLVTFYMGVREFGDFDGFIYANKYAPVIYKKLVDSGFDVDICTKSNLVTYEEQHFTWLFVENIFKEAMKYMDGVNNYNELYFNPKCFCQFLGIKIMNPRYNVFWRYVRARPSGMAELIAMIVKLKLDVPLFEIPDYNYETPFFVGKPNSKQTVERSPSEYKFYLDIATNKTEVPKVPLNKKRFVKTTKFYLQKRYRLKMSEEKILKIIKDHANTRNKIPALKK